MILVSPLLFRGRDYPDEVNFFFKEAKPRFRPGRWTLELGLLITVDVALGSGLKLDGALAGVSMIT